MKEIWKDINGYENLYQVSNLGNVKSLYFKHGYNAKLLKPRLSFDGYLRVALTKNRIVKNYSVHKLVALSFIPNIGNKPELNHKDAIKLNNKSNNIEWCTHSENMDHAVKNGLMCSNVGDKNPNAKLTQSQVNEIKQKYLTGKFTQRELAKEYNICKSSIGNITIHKSWQLSLVS
jgi:hypothetical protein